MRKQKTKLLKTGLFVVIFSDHTIKIYKGYNFKKVELLNQTQRCLLKALVITPLWLEMDRLWAKVIANIILARRVK